MSSIEHDKMSWFLALVSMEYVNVRTTFMRFDCDFVLRGGNGILILSLTNIVSNDANNTNGVDVKCQ